MPEAQPLPTLLPSQLLEGLISLPWNSSDFPFYYGVPGHLIQAMGRWTSNAYLLHMST